MQMICISGGGSNRVKLLAERLAYKLGYKSLGRQEVVEEAVNEGILVSKLETATIKPKIFTERLALEKEYYRAFITSFICRQSVKSGIVYHGRSGHLLFPGIDHVLKVRVVESEADRIKDVMQQLGIDRTKAIRYLQEVEEDHKSWARTMYGKSLEDAAYYDLVLNLGHISIENAASALATIAQLPDFQMTPASKWDLEDLMLGANARVFLARDKRTFRAHFKVRADRGIVTVTYLPQDAGLAEIIPEVLTALENVLELRTTMATTNILWIDEAYETASKTFQQVVEIATKWNAAVELFQFLPEQLNGQDGTSPADGTDPASARSHAEVVQEYTGGIEEEEEPDSDDSGLRTAQEALARIGRSGGGRQVRGGGDQIIKSIDQTVPYSLVVIGNVFKSKGHSAQIRMVRQLQGYVSDYIKAPVVSAEDLQAQYLFSPHDLLKLFGYMALVALIIFFVFTNQEPILRFLSGIEWKAKVFAAVAIFLFVPTIAYLYGNVARSLMKLIRME